MRKIRSAIADYWQVFLLSAAALIALTFLYTYRLGSLTGYKLSSAEIMAHNNDLDWHALVLNPINAPYKLFDFIFIKINAHNVGFARASAVIFAMLACVMFYAIVDRWHGMRSAVLTTMLFATSGWLLHVGRLATGDSVMLIIPLIFIMFASWLAKTEQHGRALLFMTFATGVALFTPGAMWFLIAAFLLYIKPVAKHIYYAKFWEKIVSVIALAYFAILLTYVLIRSPELIKAWLAIPATMPHLLTLLTQWANSGLYLFVRGPSDASLWLAHIPIFDLFSAFMFLVGAYFYIRHIRNQRAQLLGIFALIASLLVAFQGAPAMSYLVPVAYLVVGTGLTYFLRRWLMVFPRNPIARGIGIGLISLVVVAASGYHIYSYFIAWRYSPAITAVFQEHV